MQVEWARGSSDCCFLTRTMPRQLAEMTEITTDDDKAKDILEASKISMGQDMLIKNMSLFAASRDDRDHYR